MFIFTGSRNTYLQLALVSLFFILIIVTSSCHSTPHTKSVTRDSITIQLPASIELANGEKNRLHAACQAWYDTYLKNSGFNGGVLVAKNGNVVFELYKGTLHLGGTDTVTNTTPMHIASVSKTFTAMSVLMLMQQEKLNIDDPLSKYLPGFNYPGVTVKSLLSHRSGLPNYLYFMEDLGWDKSQFISNQDVLNSLVQHKSDIKNIGIPDRSFNYCNTNYVLLALLVEKISGLTFPEYLKNNFFLPLHMNNTHVFTLADSVRVSPSYDWRGREIPINFLDVAYGDKNIYTTPEDLLTWDRALSSNSLFTQSTLDMAYTPYSNEKPGVKNYGLGWRMNLYPNGKKMIFHNGWWHGSNAVFIRLIAQDATIIVIGNRYTNAVYKAKHLANIFDSYFEESSDEENESITADTLVSKL